MSHPKSEPFDVYSIFFALVSFLVISFRIESFFRKCQMVGLVDLGSKLVGRLSL